jgi:hypothetical protein
MGKLAGTVLVLIILSFLAACGGTAASDTPVPTLSRESAQSSDTPAPTATVEPTYTPAPTDTPNPTDTLQPSSTPAPANTAAPTSPSSVPAATEPQVSPEVAAYIQDLKTIFTAYPGAVRSLNDLMQDPHPDDGAWLSAMETNLVTLKSVYENVRELSPPQELEEIHAGLTDALGTCNGVTDVALEGFRNQDRGILEQAANLAKSCADQMRQVTGLLNQYGAGIEIPQITIP